MGRLIDLVPLGYTDAVVVVGAAVLGLTAGVLGVLTLLRERSLMGDAVAHATLPGVCLAFLVTGAKDGAALLVGAAAAGTAAAVAMVAVERTGRVRPDAATAVVLSSSFSLGVVLLTFVAGRGDADQAGLDTYLFGQAAGLVEADLRTMVALAAGALALVAVAHRALKTTLFDAAFAASVGLPVRAVEVGATALTVVAVVVGLRTVGAVLMVAMLVAPAAAARQLCGRTAVLLPLSGAVGAGIGVAGAVASGRAEVPTGPVVVLVGVAGVVACVALAPGRGVAWRARRLARDRRAARAEGLLFDLERAGAGVSPVAAAGLAVAPRSRRALRGLERSGLVARGGGTLALTPAGRAAAGALAERRALWSAWLEHGWRLGLADAREADPHDVAGSLGPEAADRLRALAGGAR